MLSEETKAALIENYRKLFREHGASPMATQNSLEGQIMRFEQLAKLGDLSGRSVLDLGCGIGDFYPYLKALYPDLQYTGIDIVPEMIEHASKRYPEVKFKCRDVLREGVGGEYDYVLICGVFNNAIPDCTTFLKNMTEAAFAATRVGLAFNFISNRVNFTSPDMRYHDPVEILGFCIDRLSRKVNLHHHYAKCDVSVFVYR